MITRDRVSTTQPDNRWTDLCLVLGPTLWWTTGDYTMLAKQQPEVFLGHSVRLVTRSQDVRCLRANKVVVVGAHLVSTEVIHTIQPCLAESVSKDPIEFWMASEATRRMVRIGCCSACAGRGTAYIPETNGRCWECYGTGHLHPEDQTCLSTPRSIR